MFDYMKCFDWMILKYEYGADTRKFYDYKNIISIIQKKMSQYCIQSEIIYSETCIKRSPLGLRKHGFLKEVQFK